MSFYERLDPTIAQSNHDAAKIVQLTEDGYERHYLHLVHNETVYGLACLNYDASNLGGHRCYIRHLSTIHAKHLK